MTAPANLPRKARERNPRRVALEMLKEAKRIAAFMVDRWSQLPSTSYYRDPGADKVTHHYPPRRRADIDSSEYIESDPRYWAELHSQMRQLEEEARKIREFAYIQFGKTGGTYTKAPS